jgi:ATP-dependent protease ClpP protease subunit
MRPNHKLYTGFSADEEENERGDKRDDLFMLNKRLEKYFFEKRTINFWGVVDDKSAKEIVTKLLLLDALISPAKRSNFILTVRVAWSPAAW